MIHQMIHQGKISISIFTTYAQTCHIPTIINQQSVFPITLNRLIRDPDLKRNILVVTQYRVRSSHCNTWSRVNPYGYRSIKAATAIRTIIIRIYPWSKVVFNLSCH